MLFDAVYELAGPFLIPIALFVAGLVGYAALLTLTRLLGDD
ncbi:MAG: hypothetical protein ABEJ79_07265 [Halolamina sp.]